MTIPQMLKAKRQHDFDALPALIQDEIRLLVSWWNRYNWEGKENWIARIAYGSNFIGTAPLTHGQIIHYVQAALRGELQMKEAMKHHG